MFVKMDDKGRLYHERPDGTLEPIEVPAISSMSVEEIEASAAADTENPPITAENEAKLRRVQPTAFPWACGRLRRP